MDGVENEPASVAMAMGCQRVGKLAPIARTKAKPEAISKGEPATRMTIEGEGRANGTSKDEAKGKPKGEAKGSKGEPSSQRPIKGEATLDRSELMVFTMFSFALLLTFWHLEVQDSTV